MTDNQLDKDIDKFLDRFGGNKDDAISAIVLHRKSKPTVDVKTNISGAVKQPKGELLVNIQTVGKTYKTGRQKLEVLKDINLEIYQGEFVAIVGPSGSGKSTLLQLIGGLDKPTTGSVVIDSHNLSKLSDKKISEFRNKTIGFVFQFFYLQPFLNLQTNIEVPAMFARAKKTDRRKLSAELAEKVGLSDRLTHLPKELSGGQMQRAAIARALLNSPKLILADEPTGNLDRENSEAIVELFKKVREDFGTTVIIVTHDQSIAKQADRVVEIIDGVLTNA